MTETWEAGKRQIEGRKGITDPLPQGLPGSGHSSLFACAHSAILLSSYTHLVMAVLSQYFDFWKAETDL